jgi:hypothetical protein
MGQTALKTAFMAYFYALVRKKKRCENRDSGSHGPSRQTCIPGFHCTARGIPSHVWYVKVALSVFEAAT